MTLNRVVVTGYGLTSPIGNTQKNSGIIFMTVKLVSDQLLNLIILKSQFIMLGKSMIFLLINILFVKIKTAWINIHFMRFMRL